MTTTRPDHPWTDEDPEPLSEAGAVLLDLVAAVDFLRRGIRPGFNVWDALEEALRNWTIEEHTHTSGAPDPEAIWAWKDPLVETLRWTIQILDDQHDASASEAFQQAIRHWTTTMSDRFNSGCEWPPASPE